MIMHLCMLDIPNLQVGIATKGLEEPLGLSMLLMTACNIRFITGIP